MAAPLSPRSPLAVSPSGPYRGVGTLLKHWGNSEVVAVEEKKIKICEASGLESLINLSRMPHVKVQSLAMAVISSLVEGANGDISINSEEGFRPLVELTKFAEDEVQREAVWSLAILASNSSCQARIEHEVGWHNFRKYAASSVPEIQAGTAILLGNLALEKKNQENMMVKGVPLLLTMLGETKDAKVRRAVVTALSNVSIIEGYGAKDVWLDKGIEMMMPFIDQGTDMQLQIGALNTIANVCNHDKAVDLKRKVAQLGGIGRLVPLLDSQDEMIVKLAAMTVANMASDDNHRNVMHGLHIEEPLIRLLDSRDEEVQLGVTMAINALADHEGTRKAFHSRNAAESLKELIHVTKDRDIAKEAKEALGKVAPEVLASLNLKDRSDSDGSYSSDSGSYSDDDDDDDDEDNVGESDDDSASHSDSDTSTSVRSDALLKKSISVLKQEEAKRIEEQHKAKEEQKRKLEELQAELGQAQAESAEEEHPAVVEKKQGAPEAVIDESGPSNSKENGKRKMLVTDGADASEVDGGEIDTDKEEELRLQRKESERTKEEESSDEEGFEVEKTQDSSRVTLPSEDEKPVLTEAEQKKLEEEENERKEAEKKKAEADAIRKEEEERIRKIEEDAFKRREEVAARRDIENEELAVDEAARNMGKGKNRVRTSSIDSFAIPKNPAKNLVHLLRDADHKKGVTREALRELEKFSARRDKEQLQFGEDIIAILIYIIYFYPEETFPDILTLTLYLLAILARYHVKNQLAIRRARGGEQIVRLLASNIESIKRNAALALGAFSLNNKSVQAEVSRAIPLLVRTLENLRAPATTLRTVAACLASIVDTNTSNQEAIIQAGGLKATVTLMLVDRHFIRSCLHLLAAIVSHNEQAQNLLLHDHPKVLPDLIFMSTSADHVPYLDSVTNALVELVKKNTRVQQGLYLLGGLPKIVPLLEGFVLDEDRRKQKIRANIVFVLYTLVKLGKYTSKVRTELGRLRVVDMINPMCASRSPNLAELAMNLTKAIEARR